MKGHTFSLNEHETPADAHGRHTADIDFYAPGGVTYRFTWTPSLISGPGSCGNFYCGPGSFVINPGSTPADRPTNILQPIGSC